MSNLNQLIYEASPSDRFATFFYGVFNPHDRAFDYVNAAHDAPMLFRSASGDIIRLDKGGVMIGGFRAMHYQQGSVTLDHGDTVVMFTDGVTEAMNPTGEEFGEERIVAAVRRGAGLPAVKLVDQIMGTLDTFTGSAPQNDDITLVVIRIL